MLNEAYSRVEYRVDREGFDSVPALIRYYVGNRKPVSQVSLNQDVPSFEQIITQVGKREANEFNDERA